MKSFIFESWRSWKICFVAGVKNMSWGLCRIITAIILGIVSLFVHLWRLICRFVGCYPGIALGGFIVISFIVWFLTFVSMRSRAVTAETQRDSISWQYYQFKEQHGYE